MKYFLTLFVCCLIGNLAPAQAIDKDCLSRMKKGVFISDQADQLEVIRTSKEYVEVYNDGDSKLFHQIVWENDSTYTLTMKRAVNFVGCLSKGEQIHTVITGCSGNRYFAYTISDQCGMSQEVFVKTH